MRKLRTLAAIKRDGFPPKRATSNPQQPDEDAESFFADLAHRATHGGDPHDRAMMKLYTLGALGSPRELPPSVREWLAFVLVSIGDPPHRHWARPRDWRAKDNFLFDLAQFERRHAGPLKKQVLLDAVHKLGKGMSTIKAARRDPVYKALLASMLEWDKKCLKELQQDKEVLDSMSEQDREALARCEKLLSSKLAKLGRQDKKVPPT